MSLRPMLLTVAFAFIVAAIFGAGVLPAVAATGLTGDTSGTYLTLTPGSTEIMRLTSTSVGIGTTTMTEKLTMVAGGNVKMGYERVNGSCTSWDCTATATCSSGKYVLGGGCTCPNWCGIKTSYKSASNTWSCACTRRSPSTPCDLNTTTSYAVCANMR